MQISELHWLAGLLEGEGSFLKGPPSETNRIRITLAMTDEDVVRRAADLVGIGYLQCRKNPKKEHWKPYYALNLRGQRAADLMRDLRPLMGSRRQAQIDKALESFVPLRSGDNSRKLTMVEVACLRGELEKPGTKILQLANKYGVSRATVKRIRDNKSWKSRVPLGMSRSVS